MPIVVNLDVMLAKRKMNLTELSFRVGITIANMSVLKSGKAKAIRFSTLDEICKVLNCQPGDLLEYMDEDSYKKLMDDWYNKTPSNPPSFWNFVYFVLLVYIWHTDK